MIDRGLCLRTVQQVSLEQVRNKVRVVPVLLDIEMSCPAYQLSIWIHDRHAAGGMADQQINTEVFSFQDRRLC